MSLGLDLLIILFQLRTDILMNTMPLNKGDRMRGALLGMFVGDALAMPVHWYYNIAALWQDFGQLKDYQAAL